MAKVKTPLLSLEAHGTLGNSLTWRKHGPLTIVETIPTHPDASTWPQKRRRWQYWDAIQEWHSLTKSQQDAYRPPAGILHLTAFQYFLHYYLTTLKGPLIWLPFDYGQGITAYDYARQQNNGIILGATWSTGKIRGALAFDGLDDYVKSTKNIGIDGANPFTMDAWVKPNDPTANFKTAINLVLNASETGRQTLLIYNSYWFIWTYFEGDDQSLFTVVPVDSDWQHIALTYDDRLRFYKNGLLGYTSPPFTAQTIDDEICIGTHRGYQTALYNWNGLIDQARVYPRALSPARILHIATQELTPPPSYLPS